MTTLAVHGPTDMIAAAVVALGFHPEESLVLLTFKRGGFCARVDLPRTEETVGEVVDMIVGACTRNEVDVAAVVAFTTDPHAGAVAGDALAVGLASVGIDVVTRIVATESRFLDDLGNCGPYDLTAHEFVSNAVMAGRVVLRSRADLASDLEPVGEPVPICEVEPTPGRLGWLGLIDTLQMTDDEVSLFAALVEDQQARDVYLARVNPDTAPRHVELLTHVLRRLPADRASTVATLLAYSAWQAGQGALAWLALDKVTEPRELADLVGTVLVNAVNPRRFAA